MNVTSYAAGFGATVTDYAFAPNGQTLVVTAVNTTPRCLEAKTNLSNGLYTYDLATGALLNTFQSEIFPVTVALGNDLMIVAGDQGIEVWRGGKVVSTLENEHLRFVTRAELSPDGRYAVFSTRVGQLYIWDTATLEVGGPPLALMATANGRTTPTFTVTDDVVIYFENNNVHVFSLGAYSDITVFDVGQPVPGLDYHADTQRLAIVTLAEDRLARTLTFYQFTIDAEADPELLVEIEDLPLPIGLDVVRFSPDGALVFVSANGSADLPLGPYTLAYSAESGEPIGDFAAQGGAPVEFNADGTVLGLSLFGTLVEVYTVP
jgi:WD40 repeat protein